MKFSALPAFFPVNKPMPNQQPFPYNAGDGTFFPTPGSNIITGMKNCLVIGSSDPNVEDSTQPSNARDWGTAYICSQDPTDAGSPAINPCVKGGLGSVADLLWKYKTWTISDNNGTTTFDITTDLDSETNSSYFGFKSNKLKRDQTSFVVGPYVLQVNTKQTGKGTDADPTLISGMQLWGGGDFNFVQTLPPILFFGSNYYANISYYAVSLGSNVSTTYFYSSATPATGTTPTQVASGNVTFLGYPAQTLWSKSGAPSWNATVTATPF